MILQRTHQSENRDWLGNLCACPLPFGTEIDVIVRLPIPCLTPYNYYYLDSDSTNGLVEEHKLAVLHFRLSKIW